jgi:hypothetical protein
MMSRRTLTVATLLWACGGNSHTVNPDSAVNPDAGPTLAELCGAPSGASWQRCSANPLVTGTRPSADGRMEWTQADPTVMYDTDDHLWKAWWSTVITADCTKLGTAQDVHEIDIKYAWSSDGVHWTIQPTPAMKSHTDPAEWDDTTVETPTVIKDPTAIPAHRYALIYAGGNDAQLKVLGQTGWQLGLAYSADGTSFTRIPASESPYASKSTPFSKIDGLLLLSRDAFPALSGLGNGILADPELHVVGGVYELYFSSAAVATDSSVKAYGVSRATSSDLVHWTMTPQNPVLANAATPAVQTDASGVHTMWFHADTMADKMSEPTILFPTLGVWKATSPDGIAWTTQLSGRDLQWSASTSYETYGLLPGVAVARGPDGANRMYYSGWGSQPAPAGSCVFTQTGIVPGTASLDLVTEP